MRDEPPRPAESAAKYRPEPHVPAASHASSPGERLTFTTDALATALADRYVIDRLIGEGGMARTAAPDIANFQTAHMLQRVDHLVYAAPDLDAACAEIERRLGVASSPGGQHIGRGTRNALVAIGPRSYLEIIAPDPGQPRPNGPRWFSIDSIEAPRLVAWAASATNLSQLVADAAGRGVHLGSVTSGSRKRADGVALTWEVTDPTTVLADGVVPFFIDWKTSPHPATSATVGPTMVELRGRHPNPERVREILDTLGIELPIERGDRAELVATFRSERGVLQVL